MEAKLYSRQAVGSPCGSQQQPAIDNRWGSTAIKEDQAQINLNTDMGAIDNQ